MWCFLLFYCAPIDKKEYKKGFSLFAEHLDEAFFQTRTTSGNLRGNSAFGWIKNRAHFINFLIILNLGCRHPILTNTLESNVIENTINTNLVSTERLYSKAKLENKK